jgi:hypothetical protein
MQIAGNKCKICGFNIILSTEGKYCAQCGILVHVACEPRPNCDLCGQPYHGYEPPEANPRSEAFVPSALRPAKSAGPILLLVAGIALLFSLLCYFVNLACRP